MRFATMFLVLFLLLCGHTSFTAAQQGFQFSKQPELQQVKPKKPVRIKLKRTSKQEYSWELTGDDVDEVVKTDRKLKKLLGVK
jgi:hypothetical protein